MWEPADVEEAIASNLQVADAALEVLRQSHGSFPDAIGLKVMAEVTRKPLETAWVDLLQDEGLLSAYAHALETQGVPVGAYVLPDGADSFDDEAMSAFSARSRGFRCLIRVNGVARGSGILVGPTTVLTAWHVLHLRPPGDEQLPDLSYEVEFMDGRSSSARLTAQVYPCTREEYERGVAPRNDTDVAEAHDLAVLRLGRPLGLGARFPSVPQPAYDYRGPGAMALLHFPDGQQKGLQFGHFRKIRGLLARWGHDIVTAPGSSGGGCFDTDFRLVGIHQAGGATGRGRMVPARRFPDALLELVASDASPEFLWSLDGAVDSPIVLAREDFFRGFHAARLDGARIRGVWVKRIHPLDPDAGLGFTFDILTALAARSPSVKLVRITLERFLEDFPNEVARRLSDAGLATAEIEAVDGVAENHTQLEAVYADRGRRAAMAADRAASDAGVRIWFYIDHPTVAFRDADRWAFDGFVGQALLQPNLRLVIAGFEAVQLPGEIFQTASEADTTGRAGLFVEYIDGFTLSDVRFVLERALEDLSIVLGPDQLDRLLTAVLLNVEQEGAIFKPWAGRVVGDRINGALKAIMQGARP